ncbi:putative bifunctional diguanylate cyclase/phosphodiesterase [Caulobacter sp. KR2-114]|uniref:putative bifunctional diguanylate cyclase/phosphodiesterase n=1 Tax=Caulobacter sp. KR2-114 TaxID=3400912 RepID=UPI003C0D6A02
MTRDALALAETRPAAPEPELGAAPSLSAVLVSPRLDNGAELGAMLREALPDENLLAYAKASEAISRTRPELTYDRPAAIWLFDFRGKPVGDLADELRTVKAARPDVELIVVTEADGAAVGPCLQVTQTPERLTFLLAPLHRAEVVQAIRLVADRYLATHTGRQALEDSQRQIRRLETDLGELHARLDIALHAARHDSLTGIMNRAGFVTELRERLDRSRQRQTVLMIDLDRFKSVNDTLGHDAGDDLVRKICTAMSAVVPAGGILARLGGDEFGVILEGATTQGIADFCGLILRICSQSRRVGGYEVQVSASIGVAHQGASASEVTLMRHADLALYAAKREGRNRYRVYDTVIDAQAKHRLTIESGLERALTSAQFRMAYQPIVKADSGAIQGFEALIRWESPELGAISPADFVPVAEETGIIQELGDWITRQAFKDCRRWGGPYVSVNLSARQFLRHNIAQQILQYAEDADLPPQRIQIELTETAIIDDVERADFNLNVLRAAGVRVALDDFGTGYSSLVYLNQFAIDCIKIDKSFVDNVTRDRQSAVIVASVSKLASSLGMGVVAEGVETEAQRQVLIAAGCGSLQGYHFGRPMAAKDVIAMLAGPTAG